jgi:hypothetical protein
LHVNVAASLGTQPFSTTTSPSFEHVPLELTRGTHVPPTQTVLAPPQSLVNEHAFAALEQTPSVALHA